MAFICNPIDPGDYLSINVTKCPGGTALGMTPLEWPVAVRFGGKFGRVPVNRSWLENRKTKGKLL